MTKTKAHRFSMETPDYREVLTLHLSPGVGPLMVENDAFGEPHTLTDDPTPALPEPIRRGLEERADTYSLEGLQSERRALVEQLKGLEYLFSSGRDNEQAVRRQHRDGIATLIGRELKEAYEAAKKTPDGVLLKDYKEPSEAALDRMANVDPRHLAFCNTLKAQYDEWYVKRNELLELQERIETRQPEINAYSKEIGLSR